ncbi:MAG: ZIP family metal transporter [Lachnospiraceae bacterium]|nr:ZIP family metal transporter [Lachnospiraceae bacterium]
MEKILWVILITAIAGVGGTGLGGIVGVILKRDSARVVSLLLAFAGGIMLAVVMFDLIPEAFLPEGAVEELSLAFVIFGILLGFGTIYLLNMIIDKRVNPEIAHIDENHPATADHLDELIHADHLKMHTDEGNKYEMFIAGIVMACAIGLHNIPEGMVIGASYASTAVNLFTGSGFLVAVVIGLHNIPEGMSVSVPLVTGGMKPAKAVCVTALSGASTVVGAIIGLIIGLVSPVWLSLSLSFAGGAMLYVVLGELLPESFLMWKSKAPGAMTLVGILVGLLLIRG